jgi:hypothetical protein
MAMNTLRHATFFRTGSLTFRLRILATLGGLMFAVIARGNTVLDWNAAMMNAIRTDNSSPTLSSRNLAILNIAVYDAINSITRTHQAYRFQPPVEGRPSLEAAAAAAGREILKTLYLPLGARAETLFEEQMALLPATQAKTNGIRLGTEVAKLVLQWRQDDGANTQVPYIPDGKPGQWRRTPPFFRPPTDPHWRHVRPFGIPGAARFAAPPPPALDSSDYAAAFNEVKSLGALQSETRTAEQKQIAEFWSDFSYTAMPPGHWHEIAAAIARNRNLPLAECARLFALLGIAHADAGIACWETKYRYNTWRPVTAIRRAAEDNNDATIPEAAWTSLLVSPPFPEYTSGHSSFSKAAATVLARFLGTDTVSFTAQSDTLPGVFRSYTSLSACADEVGMSRIYGGIHFQFANREGKRCGERIAEHVVANWLLPVADLPLVLRDDTTNAAPVLRVHGRIGETCVLEVSPDSKRWTTLATNVAIPGGWTTIAPEGTAYQRVKTVQKRD